MMQLLLASHTYGKIGSNIATDLFKDNFLKLPVFIIFLCFSVITFTTADAPKSRPDSHAPIGVMGEHAHKAGEVMLSYRFMTMDMHGLQSGTTVLETTDVLKDFMTAPTQMGMQMHMLGAMFAPHDKITLMAMTSYQQRHMEMQGAHHRKEGHHGHPIETHEMSSAGIGDTKLEALLTLWKKPHHTLLGNIGVSLPTGSIEQNADNGQLLPYSNATRNRLCSSTSRHHDFRVSRKLVLWQPTARCISTPYQRQ